MSHKRTSRANGAKGGAIGRALRVLCGVLTIGAAFAPCGPVLAAPAVLANEADIAALAARIEAYGGASRVRWIVAARTRAEADALVANISLRLPSADRGLMERVKAQTFAENPDVPQDASIPIAWMAPQLGQSQTSPTCSWQVWVSDPDFPSATAGAVNVPLAPNDRLPVSPNATFRVGYTGLLQSRLYAFGETRPGAIRDLASAPDVNIPVASGAIGETILLAMARQPAPILEGIRTALSKSAGQRQDLGKQYALHDTLLGKGRGIGAHIQSVAPDMVAVKDESGASPKSDAGAHVADAHAGDLMETCQFSLLPAQGNTQ